jgi:hypothetical protein
MKTKTSPKASAPRKAEPETPEQKETAAKERETAKLAAKGETPELVPIADGGTKRSGGPLVRDPDAEPEVPTHSPDLGDNPAAEREFNGAGHKPIDIKTLDDVQDITERIRTADKADVLYYWFKKEQSREDGARQSVLDAIVAQLRVVQGDPLPDEILSAVGVDVRALEAARTGRVEAMPKVTEPDAEKSEKKGKE